MDNDNGYGNENRAEQIRLNRLRNDDDDDDSANGKKRRLIILTTTTISNGIIFQIAMKFRT